MNKANTSPEEDKELVWLIARYESQKSDKQNFYLDAEQILEIAEWYELHDKPAEAYEALVCGLNRFPDHAGILTSLAYSYIDKGQLKEAKRIAEFIDDELSIETNMLRVEILLLENKLLEAEILLDTLSDEEDGNLCVAIAELFIRTNHFSQGLLWLQNATMLAPNDENLIETVAEYCHNIGKNEDAIYYFNMLIDKQPYSADYWVGLAKIYFSQEQYDKTIEACDFALISNVHSGDAHLFKAHSLYQLENYEESVKEYKEVLLLGNFLAEYVYSYIGGCYSEMQEWKQACVYYKKALQGTNELDDPKKMDIYANLATCFYKMGHYDEAHDLCRTMKALFPNYLDAYLLDGRMYNEEGEEEKAGKCWDKILSKNTDDIYVLTQVGEYCLDTGNLIRAKKALERAVSIDSNSIITNIFLILTYIRLKDWKNLIKIHKQLGMPTGDKLKTLIQEYYEGDESLGLELLEAIEKFEKKVTKEKKIF
ncbi:Lipopolysaccharide assembly protein B [termite gut metagenome]|uniref:Lipopolysaccharide assembly protein B n=1 Tax=termite gut metagenome TaxID=433724 RepID=A0A5J4SLU3_9ZZZZ